MRILKQALSVAVAAVLAVSLTSCGPKSDNKPKFKETQSICELATIEVYYHNVAKFERDADTWPLPNLPQYGYKRMWFEYVASVRFGIDASKVEISQPDENNVVTITIPKAELLSEHGTIYEGTMSTPVTETGFLTTLTADDKMKALNAAQDTMMETARSDETLVNQAQNRAEVLLENYVKSAGESIGEEYTVEFVEAE